MKKAALVFISQFFYILLLGSQQINVIAKDYTGAAFVSLLLGVLGFQLTATIAAVRGATWRSGVWWAYVIAGPLGIVVAMATHH